VGFVLGLHLRNPGLDLGSGPRPRKGREVV
jgi:hypothetical protein